MICSLFQLIFGQIAIHPATVCRYWIAIPNLNDTPDELEHLVRQLNKRLALPGENLGLVLHAGGSCGGSLREISTRIERIAHPVIAGTMAAGAL